MRSRFAVVVMLCRYELLHVCMLTRIKWVQGQDLEHQGSVVTTAPTQDSRVSVLVDSQAHEAGLRMSHGTFFLAYK